jgi:hypothetical protein
MWQMSQGADSGDRGGKHGWRRLIVRLRVRQVDINSSRIKGLLRSVGLVLVLALILGGFGVVFASKAGTFAPSQTADSGPTATASLSAIDTSTPGDMPTMTVSGMATTTPSSTSTSSSTSAGIPPAPSNQTSDYFHLESATVTADPSDNFTHACSAMVNETFTVTLTADANGPSQTVSYDWEDMYANGTQPHSGMITFAPGETSKTFTIQQGFNAGRGDGSAQRPNISVTYPDSWMWAPPQYNIQTVSFTCVRQLTNLTLTPSISSWDAPCGSIAHITFTWILTASPGPTILAEFAPKTESNPGFATWWAPNSTQVSVPATTGPDQPSTQVSGSFNDALASPYSNGTYWIQMATTSPSALTARATVIQNC